MMKLAPILPKLSPVYVLLLGSVLWGLIWLPLKYFNRLGIEGVPLILVGYGAMAVLFLPTFIKQTRYWRKQLKFLWLIFFFGGFANLAFTTAIMYGDVVRVMVLFYLLPAWGVLGGRFFLKEHIDKTRWIAVTLALSGAFFVLGAFNIFNAAPTWIDLLALASGFALSMNNIAFRASPELPLGSKLAVTFAGSFLLSALLVLLNFQVMPSIPINNWLLVIAFVCSWILVASLATQWAVTLLEAGRASILLIVELIVAVISALWIGGESMSGPEIMGGIMILAAAVLETRR